MKGGAEGQYLLPEWDGHSVCSAHGGVLQCDCKEGAESFLKKNVDWAAHQVIVMVLAAVTVTVADAAEAPAHPTV